MRVLKRTCVSYSVRQGSAGKARHCRNVCREHQEVVRGHEQVPFCKTPQKCWLPAALACANCAFSAGLPVKLSVCYSCDGVSIQTSLLYSQK